MSRKDKKMSLLREVTQARTKPSSPILGIIDDISMDDQYPDQSMLSPISSADVASVLNSLLGEHEEK